MSHELNLLALHVYFRTKSTFLLPSHLSPKCIVCFKPSYLQAYVLLQECMATSLITDVLGIVIQYVCDPDHKNLTNYCEAHQYPSRCAKCNQEIQRGGSMCLKCIKALHDGNMVFLNYFDIDYMQHDGKKMVTPAYFYTDFMQDYINLMEHGPNDILTKLDVITKPITKQDQHTRQMKRACYRQRNRTNFPKYARPNSKRPKKFIQHRKYNSRPK